MPSLDEIRTEFKAGFKVELDEVKAEISNDAQPVGVPSAGDAEAGEFVPDWAAEDAAGKVEPVPPVPGEA
eukprot:CAMPEP_0179314460 /NCGR_PEP_ID=MMETSP0797-20121207/54469_1 /TAXON_ID=47934 /ORGANISM="Dinophysis acuminata, Strain DAEP01" /LENGTH=69 /DNA_ID=CAMNT_0021024777 /DNA_START=89 /DNA_END=295 /DNA_ORIENTATION=-